MTTTVVNEREERNMARARMYALVGEPKKAVTGQAAVVLAELKRDTSPRLASAISEAVEKSGALKTRQDVLRVTLYYILIFKKAGIVAATDQPIEADAENLEDAETLDA